MNIDKIGEVDPSSITIIKRSECYDLIKSFGTRRFTCGYIKIDGSYRVFHAQTPVNKYKISPTNNRREKTPGSIILFDLDIASKIARRLNIENINADDLPEVKEIELRKSYRMVYPQYCEILKCGKIYVVEDPTVSEIINLVNEAEDIIENNTLNENLTSSMKKLALLKNALLSEVL